MFVMRHETLSVCVYGHISVTWQEEFLAYNIDISCYIAKFTALFTSVKLRCYSRNHSGFEHYLVICQQTFLKLK